MEKPFDLKDLGERLKKQGLPVAEDAIEKVAGEFFDWAGESCALHENAIVKAVGMGVIAVKPFAMAQIDKIDGVVGQ